MNNMETTRRADVAAWDYDASVGRVRPMVLRWGQLTVEMLGELWTAREALSSTGAAGHVANLGGTDVPPKTWADYCADVGLEKRTANRWLGKYDPERRCVKELPAPDPKALSVMERHRELCEQAREAAAEMILLEAHWGRLLNRQEECDRRNVDLQERARKLLEEDVSLDYADWSVRSAAIGAEWERLFADYYEIRELDARYDAFRPDTPEEKQHYKDEAARIVATSTRGTRYGRRSLSQRVWTRRSRRCRHES
jgi:hypothetical protein